MSPPPREAELVRQVLQLLRLLGVPAWRCNSGAATFGQGGRQRFVKFCGAEGCADVLGLLPPSGRFLAVEVKRPGGRPTAAQAAFLANVAAAGGLALVVHSAAELRAALAAAGLRC
jgi:hypothetical protein